MGTPTTPTKKLVLYFYPVKTCVVVCYDGQQLKNTKIQTSKHALNGKIREFSSGQNSTFTVCSGIG